VHGAGLYLGDPQRESVLGDDRLDVTAVDMGLAVYHTSIGSPRMLRVFSRDRSAGMAVPSRIT
jgi:hypothetical protein